MLENMETPAKLASAIIADFKQGADSILDACSKIAKAWKLNEEGGPWSEDKFVSFIDRLADAKIGPGSSVFYPETKKEGSVFKKSTKAGVYYQLMAVGKCEAFKTKEFRQINRTASYSVLYRLSVLYNRVFDRGSGGEKQRTDRASKAVLDLVRTHGVSLTREEVDKAIAKIGARLSRAPAVAPASVVEMESSGSHTTIDDLIAGDNRYDLVLITPTEEALLEAASCSSSTLMDKAPYQELMSSKSKAVLIGSGRQLDGLTSLAQVSGNLDKVYCVRRSNDKSKVIDLSKELLVFANSALDFSGSPKKGETAEDFVHRVVSGSFSKGRRLHLFADAPQDGWDTVVPSRSFKEE
jgi:hypothetical protein